MGGIEIKSDEGTTQEDPGAVPAYALGIALLISCLAEPNRKETCAINEEINRDSTEGRARQSTYADDLSGSGTIDELKQWWDMVIELGPFIGYYANHRSPG